MRTHKFLTGLDVLEGACGVTRRGDRVLLLHSSHLHTTYAVLQSQP